MIITLYRCGFKQSSHADAEVGWGKALGGLIFSGCACRALSTSLKNVCPGRTRQDMLAQLLPKTAISQGHIRLVIRSHLRECAVGLEGDTPAQKAKKYSRRLVRNLSQTSRRPLTNLSQTSRNLSETSHKPLGTSRRPLT